METSEDDLGLGQPQTLAHARVADLAGDVFEGEPSGPPPGEQVYAGGPRAVLARAGRDAGALEPFVLEHRLEPWASGSRSERVPALVVAVVEHVSMLADVLASENDPGRLDAGIYAVPGAVGEVARRVGTQEQVRNRTIGPPDPPQRRRGGVGGDVLPLPVKDADRDRGPPADRALGHEADVALGRERV